MARNAPAINAGSMADIAFLILIFFMVTTTMDVDTGIMRTLPPPPPEDADIPDINERNIMKILVSKSDRLLINDKIGDIRTLRADVKEFMSIHIPDNPNYPQVEEKFIEGLGNIWFSKGVISLKNDRGTSYGMYIQVQNELAAAFRELRDEFSMQRYGRRYEDLTNEDVIKAINKAIPVRVSEAEPEDVGGN